MINTGGRRYERDANEGFEGGRSFHLVILERDLSRTLFQTPDSTFLPLRSYYPLNNS